MIDQDQSKTVRGTADAEFENSEYRAAASNYAKLISEFPQHARASDYRKFAVSLIELERWVEALQCLASWELVEPKSAPLYSMRGYVCTQLNDLSNAEIAYRKSVELRPRASGYCMLGDLLAKANKFDDAINAFQKAVECDPHYGEAFYNLGVMYQQINPPLAAKHFAMSRSFPPHGDAS